MPSQVHATPRRVYRIGSELTRLLDERFVTQRELAAHLGVESNHISRYCRNQTGPGKLRLRQIAAFFDVEPESLLEPDQRAA